MVLEKQYSVSVSKTYPALRLTSKHCMT